MTTSNSDHPVSRRAAALAAATLTAMSAAVALAPATSAATFTPPAAESERAAAAVSGLTSGPGSTISLPADFAAVSGYRPATVDGLLVAPHGGCSSPVPLPAEFDTACKAHDLGYDLLRYADRSGAPLGPWARQALDHTLDVRMRQACAARTEPIARIRCRAMAGIAATAVDLNSRRQDYGVPVVETLFGAGFVGSALRPWTAVGGGLAAFAAVLGIYARRARSGALRRAPVSRRIPAAGGVR
ncbi:hypothetical protein [Nocardia donostiensis]|nr:hypothetical protein [Nocardia donostiensis]